jgi:hypothetical protein
MRKGKPFTQGIVLFEQALKVSSIAELGDNITVVITFEYLITL